MFLVHGQFNESLDLIRSPDTLSMLSESFGYFELFRCICNIYRLYRHHISELHFF